MTLMFDRFSNSLREKKARPTFKSTTMASIFDRYCSETSMLDRFPVAGEILRLSHGWKSSTSVFDRSLSS
jgi:hypothetical protein